MSQRAYYPWFPEKFRASTAHFEFDERAVYRELLDWEWTNGPLPIQHQRLANIAGLPLDRFRAAWKTVRQKFDRNGSGLVNPTLERHRAECERRISVNSKRARKAALARYAQTKEKKRDTAPSMLQASSKHANERDTFQVSLKAKGSERAAEGDAPEQKKEATEALSDALREGLGKRTPKQAQAPAPRSTPKKGRTARDRESPAPEVESPKALSGR